jgi:hypothetical protein
MMYAQHTPKKRTATYHTFTIVILPLALYVLQLLGMSSALATYAAGVLVLVKMMVEWRHQHQRPMPQTTAVPRSSLVPAQAPLAGCYLCHQLRPLWPYQIAGHRVGICQQCHHCLHFTQQADRQAAHPHYCSSGIPFHQY